MQSEVELGSASCSANTALCSCFRRLWCSETTGRERSSVWSFTFSLLRTASESSSRIVFRTQLLKWFYFLCQTFKARMYEQLTAQCCLFSSLVLTTRPNTANCLHLIHVAELPIKYHLHLKCVRFFLSTAI